MSDQETERAHALDRLVRAAAPTSELVEALARFGWDSEDPLVRLDPGHVRHVLESYVRGDRSQADVEAWADALECRDDVAAEGVVSDVLHELANPVLHGGLDPGRAQALLDALAK